MRRLRLSCRSGWGRATLALGCLLCGVEGGSAGAGSAPIESAPMERAGFHWVMHCQGCHGVQAQGSVGGAPSMIGMVSRYLHSAEGRAYLARVPGVAFVALSDAEVAELLNWMVGRFDPQHLPENFTPYGAAEVHAYRAAPLISKAYAERIRVLSRLDP